MTISMKVRLASAALALAAGSAGAASAADLGGYRGGSIKDGGYAPLPPVHAAAPSGGPCYFRSDLGYSWSRDPDVKWPVNNLTRTYTAPAATINDSSTWTQTGTTTTYVGDAVTGTTLENTWFGEIGAGCSSGGPRAVRAEVMFGYHGERKLDGEPQYFNITNVVNAVPRTPDVYDDPLHTSVTTYSLMFNVYKDLGQWGKVTPYVGAGVGLAYNIVDEVYFTGNPNLLNRIHGDRDLSFAWSLMTGVGIQVTERAVLDIGYRYFDMGKATSERHDNAFSVNPRVMISDLAAHEFKVGLRYSFGSGDCCQAPVMPAYAPLK